VTAAISLTHSPIKRQVDEEYKPMTMQVALMGKDGGIVIASDRKSQVRPLIESGARNTTGRIKIKISASRRVAVTSAVDLDTADKVADCIIAEMDDQSAPDREKRILAIAERVVSGKDIECIAAFLDPYPCFYFLECKGKEHRTCGIRFLRIYAGDQINAAIYWSEMYEQEENLSVQQMTRLSAHIVVTAAQLNPAHISGLDIVRSGEGGFSFVQGDELEALKTGARRQNELFGTLVLGD